MTIRFGPWVCAVQLAALLAVAGCERENAIDLDPETPSKWRSDVASARFVRRFCAALAPEQRPCAQWLRGAAREQASDIDAEAPVGDRGSVTEHLNEPMTTLIVSGLFSDCVARWFSAFGRAAQTLSTQGYRIEALEVGGRQSVEANAASIQEAVVALAQPGRSVLLIGYSKGALDILQALQEPEVAAAVGGFVAVGGAFYGSELIRRVPQPVQTVLEQMPLPGCERADGSLLEDLSPHASAQRMIGLAVPDSVVAAQVAGRPESNRVSWVLRPSYRALMLSGIVNDGQIALSSAGLPDGRWLAQLNADHWAMALETRYPLPGRLDRLLDPSAFPRTALLRALIDTMSLRMRDQIGLDAVPGAGIPLADLLAARPWTQQYCQ